MEQTPIETPAASSGSKFPTWAIIVIVLVVLCLVIPCCIIAVLALLGPAIGNVFSGLQ